MPTYQYRCSECGQDLEVVQKFTDDALTECPNCHGSLRKIYNAVGVVFKGSGFYSTDNRSGGPKASTGSDTSSKSDSSKSDGGSNSDSSKSDSSKSESSTKSDSGSSSSSSSSKTPAKAATS